MRNIILWFCLEMISMGCSKPETKLQEVNYAVGLDFMNEYVHEKDGEKFIQHHDLVTHSFKERYQTVRDSAFKKEPEIGLGFDPIVDGQDFPSKFKIKAVDATNTYLTLESDDQNWSNFEVVVKLIEEGKRTVIDGAGIINIPKNHQAKR